MSLTGIGQPNGIATLDSGGHVPTSQLPADVPLTDTTGMQTFQGPLTVAEGSKYGGRNAIPNYDQYLSNADASGNYTTLQLKRPGGGTLAFQSVLSNPDANGNYQTDTWTFYATDGVTVLETHVWALTWDANGKKTQAVMTS